MADLGIRSTSTTINPTPVSPTNEEDAISTTNKATFGLTGLLVFLIILVIIIFAKKRCHRNQEDNQSVLSAEVSSIFVQEDQFVRKTSMWNDLDEGIKGVIKGLLIDSRRLQLGMEIGKGQFGCVYVASFNRDTRRSNDYGRVSHEKVAVKTLKGDNIDGETVEAFLREGLIMKDFTHKNVLTLIGVAIGEGGIPMIVLPFMKHGSLKGYIAHPELMITVRELLEFGLQIAQGMDYLSKQKFVHRDLALRNCMVDEHMVVKVADFGLSRDIYTKDYYTSEDRHAKLPVKWMALESLAISVYTTKSDVWSYGVLLWELLTRGAMPYPDISNWEVKAYVQSGRRMDQPETCPDEIYELMLLCWREDPSERPSFKAITESLKSLLYPQGDLSPTDKKPSGADAVYVNLFTNVEVPATPSPDQEKQPEFPLREIHTQS